MAPRSSLLIAAGIRQAANAAVGRLLALRYYSPGPKVGRPELLSDFTCAASNRRFVRNIHQDRRHPVAKLLPESIRVGLPPDGAIHVKSVGCQHPGYAQSNTGRNSGDNDILPGGHKHLSGKG